jgi:ubiquinone/menaquinone biosynthesis C-methylase UbiE
MDMIRAASRLRRFPNLSFVVGDCESVPTLPTFDAITSFSSLHHVDNIAEALASCRRVLKPNGMLLLMEPGEGHADTEKSRQARAEFGITERSLPPAYLCSVLKSIGYRKVEVIPWLAYFLTPLSLPLARKNWKYRLAAGVLGRRMADYLELHRSRSKGVAIIRAWA